MATKIAITNEKGGCGKTTTAVNLAAILAERGYSTLLVDGDYQSYATSYLSRYQEDQATIYEVMHGASAQNAVCHTEFGFALLPSAMKFRAMEEELILAKAGNNSYEYNLNHALSPLDSSYDFIICDCPPNGDKVQENIEAYVNYLVLPTIPDDNAIHTFLVKANALARTKATINPKLSVLGALIVAENRRHKNDTLYSSAIRSQTVFHCFSASIASSTEFKKALNAHEPINIYSKRSAGNLSYQAFADEVIERTKGDK